MTHSVDEDTAAAGSEEDLSTRADLLSPRFRTDGANGSFRTRGAKWLACSKLDGR